MPYTQISPAGTVLKYDMGSHPSVVSAINSAISGNNFVYTLGDQNIAGVKTFSDNIIGSGTYNRLPNQQMIPSTPKDSIITKANYLAMNLFEAGRVFEVQASSSLIRSDTGTGTSIGAANFVHGIGSINIGNYTTSTVRMILASPNWMYSTGTGATLNYALPWAISFKFFHFLRDLNTVHRIYVGSNSNNTSFPLPLKGADPYPTGGFRGIGIEFRKNPDNLYGTQCRLFARNGYAGVNGTFIASAWTALWPESNTIGPAHHLILTNDGIGNIALFANNWNGGSQVPNMTSRTPLITLSGTGVPTDFRSVLTNWGSIEMCMVNDGINQAVPSSNQMNMYPIKIQIGNLL